MYKSVLAIMALIFSISAFSKNINLKISTTWKKGEGLTKSKEFQIKAKLGEEWIIPFDGKDSLKLKMKASNHFDDPSFKNDFSMASIMIEGDVIELKDGKENIIATPQVLTALGNEALISVRSDNGEYFEMKVLPVK